MKGFDKVYNERYKGLNPSQKRAVDSIEGPVMVIAGPGTGKTSVLVMRIASILKRTDTSPENILALTFTESGVVSMRKGLLAVIGSEANRVKIHTFHGFCNSLINDFPEEFPRIIGARHISESEQITVIESILSKGSFEYLSPIGNPFFYVRDLVGTIGTLKREGVTPDEFMDAVQREEESFYKKDDLYNTKGKYEGVMKGEHIRSKKFIDKNKELATVFDSYQSFLGESLCYDYDDMILESVKRLESSREFSVMVQEDSHYILADEHQDANSAQNRVLKELTSFHDMPNIFIVGDEKQAIFRFQGASLDNFMYFKDLYPDTEVIYLTDNYRSQQSILDASQALIKSSVSFEKELHKNLKAVNIKDSKPLRLIRSDSIKDEAASVAREAARLIDIGVDPSEIAVIYRDHKDAESFIDAFEREPVPFFVRSDKDLFKDSFIQRFITLIEAVCDPADDEKLFKALHISFLKVDPVDVFRISRKASVSGISLNSLLEDAKAIEEWSDIADGQSAIEAFRSIKRWTKLSFNNSIMTVLESMFYESGALEEALRDRRSAVIISRMRSFFKQAERFTESFNKAKLSDFLKHLLTIQSYGLSLKSSEDSFSGRVELMTAHASKGREFDYVFIVNVIDGKWGNRRNMKRFKVPDDFSGAFNSGDNEDERRLFYVSLTRARRSVYISCSRFGSGDREQLPSSFIDDIDRDGLLLKDETMKTLSVSEGNIKERGFRPVLVTGPSLNEKDHIIRTFMDQPLSITALNAYFVCPWRYFYVNLMRIPSAYTLPQRFGIAIHESLKDFFDVYKEKGDPGKDFLLERFLYALSRQPVFDADLYALQEKGSRVLSGYHDRYKGTWRSDLVTERSINDVRFHVESLSLDLALTGKLDKVEGVESLSVIDYKTGAPKSRNYIEGNTKGSEGGIKRQLVFYKLLIDMSPSFNGSMQEGVIDFIEPNGSGNYKREVFSISDDEVKDLEALISQMAEEIVSLSFWDSGCGDSKCEYCSLRRMLSA